jgi:hypothetical protein
MNRVYFFLGLFLISGCAGIQQAEPPPATPPDTHPIVSEITATGDGSFAGDVAFLKQYVEVIELSDPAGQSKVAVIPAFQGRIMTSTAKGDAGLSFGWINRKLIADGKTQEHINVFGGEDRFWMGPEGGQFSIFFKKGATAFDLANWQTPASIDTEPYTLVSSSPTEAIFSHQIHLENYSGFPFDVQVERSIRLLDKQTALHALGLAAETAVDLVAVESDNRISNCGTQTWTKESGLLSIWILGMLNPTPETTIVIPFAPGPIEELGPIVNDTYFGKVPADRLIVSQNVILFKGDGCYRSKIGIPPHRALPVAGSYDAKNKVLTLVQYTAHPGITDYVNSMWEIQKEPFGGDVINSYNDGPPEPGKAPLGPFYEIETSSPAAALAAGESMRHVHRTFHIQGSPEALDAIAKKHLGLSLNAIQSAFER